MSQFLQYVFCCLCFCPSQRSNRNQTAGNNKKKKEVKPNPKPSRIISKFKESDIMEMKKQQKSKGQLVYTCPICTQYYNKILACDQCENTMCRQCIRSYEKKFQISTVNMKCPFCNSQTSHFVDYEQEAKSYFDTTGKNGFLDANQRKKIDEQMKYNQTKDINKAEGPMRRELQRIEQEEGMQNIVTSNIIHLSQGNSVNTGIENNLQEQNSTAQINNDRISNNQDRPQFSSSV